MTGLHSNRPQSAAIEDLGFQPKDMVGWLSPGSLIQTGLRVGLSAVFGVYADKREIQAGLGECRPFDYTAEPELWIDYISDLGDGFAPTYQMALLLANDKLTVGGEGVEPVETQAGRILVMGGDEVYPTATKVEYEDRLVGPYRAALPWTDQPRELYAVPGNHDWYDGLSAFMRVFCQRDWIGGWKTVQNRSYFAIQLPHRWWLWGIDIQFDTYIDEPQRDYFEQVIGPMLRDGDSIILCSAKPNWTKVTEHPDAFANLDYFNRRLVRPRGARVRLYLTGDSHHYARYEPKVGPSPHLITAGGGGAYLSATHHLPDELTLPPPKSRDRDRSSPPIDFRKATVYPSHRRSKRLRFGVLNLPFANPGFWALVGATYGALGWVAAAAMRGRFTAILTILSRRDVTAIFMDVIQAWQGALLCTAMFFGLVGFTQEKSPVKRWALGGLHGAAQIALAVICVKVAAMVAEPVGGNLGWVAFFALLVGLGGLAGSMLMALYLLVADRFGCNGTELFAAQRIVDYKCFIRMHIDSEGTLTLYPIAVDKVGRAWDVEPEGDPEDPWFVSRRPGTDPHLIEPPVVIPW